MLPAAAPKVPRAAPLCARSGTRPVFLSPMGEPFRAEPGQPYPSAVWFMQADKDHDGFVTRAEFLADALRFSDRIDLDHDGKLTPDEVSAYESNVAPETSIYSTRSDDYSERSRRRRDPGAMAESEDYGGPMGAGRFAWLNVPEPVVAADQDVDRIVTRDEFATAAAGVFARLDVSHQGRLRLQGLPRTPQQVALEGPCRPVKGRKGDEKPSR